MTDQERELDFALAEAEAANKLLRTRNERLEREAEANIKEAYRAGVDSGIAAEREACARVCDEVDKESQSQWPKRLATMIRARGNT